VSLSRVTRKLLERLPLRVELPREEDKLPKGRPPPPPGPYLVVGLARSGQAVARVLAERGENVIGCDTGEPEVDLDGVDVHLGTDGAELLDRGVRTVVKSPGVPGEAPVIVAARERGIDVVGELELAWRLLPNDFVAVTGTNGKTTTVELLGAIWRAAGRPVAVAGNVGTPLSSLVGRLEPGVTVICEASSFQLEDTSAFSPEVAILLNVEDDHLDRHGDADAYTRAKQRIFANQRGTDHAIVPIYLDHLHLGRGCPEHPDTECEVRDGQFWLRGDPIPLDEIRLRGAHNLENVAAAALAADEVGISHAAIVAALRSFAGVEHRLEDVAKIGGVLYVNDSKATNPASALRGLEAFDGGVHAILGGSVKGGGFESLRAPVAERCRACYLIGAAADRLAADLEGTAALVPSGTLEQAVADAAAAAEPGDVVLLSPACASFDAFRDYEHRGAVFKALVRAREAE
jgi:UDP-N-acetylmuramoylalanine--D-glutamate ligase